MSKLSINGEEFNYITIHPSTMVTGQEANTGRRFIIDLYKSLYVDVLPMEAIHLTKPIQAPDGPIRKVVKGTLIAIENGELVDYTQPTHRVQSCYGTVSGNILGMVAENLTTSALENITL